MHNPSRLAPANPQYGQQRKVTGSIAVRNVRLGEQEEANLAALQQTLSGSSPEDVASVSLVFRQAVRLYWGHVSSMLNDPEALQIERAVVRLNSRLPRKREQPASRPIRSECHV